MWQIDFISILRKKNIIILLVNKNDSDQFGMANKKKTVSNLFNLFIQHQNHSRLEDTEYFWQHIMEKQQKRIIYIFHYYNNIVKYYNILLFTIIFC